MTPLSQRDKRWGEITIGKSNSKLKDFGCTLTCLSMQAGLTPDEFNARMTSVDGFQNDLILWQKISLAVPWLKFADGGRHYTYDNQIVKQTIDKWGSCLVEVDFDGITSTPSDRHWILYIGNGRAIDPWTGNEVSTSKYPVVKGFTVMEVHPRPQETHMTEEQTQILHFLTVENHFTEGEVREAMADLKRKPDREMQEAEQKQEFQTRYNQLLDVHNQVKAEIEELRQLTQHCQSQLEIASGMIEVLTEEKNKNWMLYKDKNDEFNALKSQVEKPLSVLRLFIQSLKKWKESKSLPNPSSPASSS